MKKPIQKIFIEFLKREGVFDAYVRNWDKDFSTKPIKKPYNYILQAFDWADTGDLSMWNTIDSNWALYLSKYKYKKDPCNYHTRCHDCGRFVKKELWVKKDHHFKHHALCCECLSGYDEVY